MPEIGWERATELAYEYDEELEEQWLEATRRSTSAASGINPWREHAAEDEVPAMPENAPQLAQQLPSIFDQVQEHQYGSDDLDSSVYDSSFDSDGHLRVYEEP